MSGFFIGIDVGGTNLKAGLTDETGRLLAAARRPLDFRGAETFAADLADLAAEVLSTAGAVPGDAESVGPHCGKCRRVQDEGWRQAGCPGG